ncbi:MAG TPA: hypothetical protein VLA13_04510 [Massilibacterium sp.]|nr:hypothetical protein [Massilibacterium sp.]
MSVDVYGFYGIIELRNQTREMLIMENIQNEEGYATLLMNKMDKLEFSQAPRINKFMVDENGIDWDEKPHLRQIASDLEKCMIHQSYTHPNGYTVNEWIIK